MKILMMIPCYRRPEITRMFVWHMEQTLPSYAKLIPYFIISPEDPEHKNLLKIIDGYDYFEYKNDKLGEKKNAGLQNAMLMDWDYYMDMGSDNLWTSLMWQFYEDKFNNGVPYFGLKNIYSIELTLCRALFSESYHMDQNNKPTAIGVGRCIRRDIVQDVAPLWRDDWHRGMDGISHYNITKKGYECEVIDNGKLPTVLDIKSPTNLNVFMNMERDGNKADVKQVYEWFGLNQFHVWNYTHTGEVPFSDFRDEVLRRVNIYGSQKEAFQSINDTLPEKRYANYDVYRTTQTRKLKK